MTACARASRVCNVLQRAVIVRGGLAEAFGLGPALCVSTEHLERLERHGNADRPVRNLQRKSIAVRGTAGGLTDAAPG